MSLTGNRIYRFDEFELDPSSRALSRDGVVIPIFPKAFDIFIYLVSNPGRVVTKEEIFKAVWPESFVEEGNLARQVSSLRKALGDRADCIVTVPGRGYQFAATVQSIPDPGGASLDPTVDFLVQSVRERTQVVIEESFPAPENLAQGKTLPGRFFLGSRWKWAAIGAPAALLLAAGAWFGWNRLHPSPSGHVRVAIADLENSTGDATFDRTLNKVVQIDLLQSPFFTVIGEGRLRHALQLMGRKPGAAITGEDIREACQRVNGKVYLTPAIAAIGSHYLVTMSANTCADGTLVAARKEDADSKAGVLRAVEEVTSGIRKDVGESRGSLSQFDKKLYLERTSSLDALKAYSQATDLINAGKPDDAARLFRHAIELDPGFAIAYADLSSAYFNLGDKAGDRENISKAYAMRDTVGEREQFQIAYRYHQSVTGDIHAQKDTLELWMATYPLDTVPIANASNFYNWIGQYQRAADLGAQAIQLENANGAYNGIFYEIAMRAFKHLGQFDKALELYNTAVQHKVESPACHGLALQIAALRHDQNEVNRQIAWAHGTNSEAQILQQAAMAALADGRARDSEKLFDGATAAARRDHAEGDLSTIDAYRPRILAEMGLTARARILAGAFTAEDTFLDRLYAMAELSDPARARTAALEAEKESPQDTLMNAEYAPAVLAVVALRSGKPADAVELLRAVEPYELRDPTVAYQRGQVFLAAGKAAEAEAEFRKLIDNPGIDDPLTPLHALAHLNLARALKLQNKPGEAKAEYARFLDRWKDVDPDVPVLLQARREYTLLE
jgi:DNA-binding winged helix-turn-helix (wHTH) protein/tetratricopeptide (TPR) repeat protein